MRQSIRQLAEELWGDGKSWVNASSVLEFLQRLKPDFKSCLGDLRWKLTKVEVWYETASKGFSVWVRRCDEGQETVGGDRRRDSGKGPEPGTPQAGAKWPRADSGRAMKRQKTE